VIANLISINNDVPGVRLADRSTRLIAAVVDSIIAVAYGFPLLFPMFLLMSRAKMPAFLQFVAAVGVMSIAFLLTHGYLLKKKGQTIGKKLLGIRISDLNGNVPRFGTVVLLRYFPIWFVSLIPVAGNLLSLIDVAFIFRSDRRCIHDLFAGTKVIES